jgi:hypothetical protein
MTQFAANLFTIGDIAGMGLWEDGHYRQHITYVNYLAALTTPVIIPIYNIMDLIDMGDPEKLRFWLDAHNQWHEQVRPYANVTGVDLSSVDFTNASVFYQWMDDHNAEHALIDQAFGRFPRHGKNSSHCGMRTG